jgi:hypothetical protein
MTDSGMAYPVPDGYFLTSHNSAANRLQMPMTAKQTARKTFVFSVILISPCLSVTFNKGAGRETGGSSVSLL